MKKLMTTAAIILATSSAWAIEIPAMNIGVDDFPSESGWAKAMTEKACKLDFKKSDYGVITEVEDGVVYTVYNKQNKVVAESWASSKFIWAKKSCLN